MDHTAHEGHGQAADQYARSKMSGAHGNHDRHAGNQDAMRAYLRWETELPAEIARDGLDGFRLMPP